MDVTASCKKTSLSNLWFNKCGPAPHCSTAANWLIFTIVCTTLYCLSDIPDQEQGEASWSCFFSCRPWRMFWNPLSFSLQLCFWAKDFFCFGGLFSLPRFVFLAASCHFPPFEAQFTSWWVLQHWFQKGFFFLLYMCIYIYVYTYVIQKGCLLLLSC